MELPVLDKQALWGVKNATITVHNTQHNTHKENATRVRQRGYVQQSAGYCSLTLLGPLSVDSELALLML